MFVCVSPKEDKLAHPCPPLRRRLSWAPVLYLLQLTWQRWVWDHSTCSTWRSWECHLHVPGNFVLMTARAELRGNHESLWTKLLMKMNWSFLEKSYCHCTQMTKICCRWNWFFFILFHSANYVAFRYLANFCIHHLDPEGRYQPFSQCSVRVILWLVTLQMINTDYLWVTEEVMRADKLHEWR